MLYHLYMKTLDNILNKFIKILLVVNIIIMLTIGSFFVQPVYADNDDLFEYLPVMSLDESNWLSSFILSEDPNRYASSNSAQTLAFAVGNTFYFCSPLPDSTVDFAFPIGNTPSFSHYTLDSFNSTYNLYYNNTSGSTGNASILHVPSFSSIGAGLAAAASYVPPVVDSNIYEGFRIPSGYSARISVSSGGSFDVSCVMGELCATSGVWVDNTQKYLYSDSASVDVTLSSGNLINWAPTGDLTLYGQTNNAFYSFSSVPSGTYMWITNPVYMNVANQYLDSPALNGTIVLSNVKNVNTIRLFALSTNIGHSGIGSSGSDDDYYNAVESNGAIIYTDPDGNVISDLPEYGNTQVPNSGGNQGLIERFQAILEDLVSQIENLLIAPVSHIQRIINAGSTFFTWLSGLWSWLPSDVSGIITSVLFVMAVVGGLKLLWR